MTSTNDLYQLAQTAGITVCPANLPKTKSVCVEDESRRCYIGLDCSLRDESPEQRTLFARELGYGITGALHNIYAPYTVRRKHQSRAERWAVLEMIPREELEAALSEGRTSEWELAELFGVTEDLVRVALCWYFHGTTETQYYYAV